MVGFKMSACHNLESPEQRTSPQGLSPSGGHVVCGGGRVFVGHCPDYFNQCGCRKAHPKYGWRLLVAAQIKRHGRKKSVCFWFG